MKTISLNLAKMALYLFVGLSVMLVSCSGEDGETGPAGKDGIDGKDGEDGNANVIVSDWMHIKWNIVDTYYDPPRYGLMNFQEIPGIDDLDAFMETGGVVLFYLKHAFINGIYTRTTMLPYQEDSDHIYTYYATTTAPQIYVAGLILRAESDDVTQFENNDDYLIRYVLVPANVAEASGLADKIPENFNEAAAMLGLQQ